jgi:cytochrome oxidase Cu insertion factor (SCO1/SenC/PrrC family)
MRPASPRRAPLRLSLGLVFALACPALADDPHARCREQAAQASGASAAAADGTRADVKVIDAALLDQDGRAVRLGGDVIGDRIVVMNFVYTTCTTVCPLLSARFTGLQAALGERLGPEVRLVSLSIDPLRDTPARLKAYAGRHHAGAGWLHLTGRPDEVEQVLRGLGAYSPRLADHAPMTLVGDGRTGRWTRINGFPSAAQLLAQVDALASARQVLARQEAP